MIRRMFRATAIVAFIAFSSLMIMGCGKSVSGKYTDASGAITVDFESGKATITTPPPLNTSETVDYTVSGNTITFTSNGASVNLTIQSDGSITGFPGADKLTKAGS
jgi:hypothetical protein